jgi:transposase InsO family protein
MPRSRPPYPPEFREQIVARVRAGRSPESRGLMRADGLAGVSRRKRPPRSAPRAPEAPPAPDLVRRDFGADAPDTLWVADVTYVPTHAGFLYLERAYAARPVTPTPPLLAAA